MDKPSDESLLLSNTNINIENIRKAYANGGSSIAEILGKMELCVDMESMTAATQSFIPPDFLSKCSHLEDTFKNKNILKKEEIHPKYIPGKVFYIEEMDSALNKHEQAICLNLLKMKQGKLLTTNLSSRQNYEIAEAMRLQTKVQEENAKFMEYVKNDWKQRSTRALQLKETLKSYAHTMWQNKLNNVLSYPSFYKPEGNIPFSCSEQTESNVVINHIANLYEIGVVPKLVLPCLENAHLLKVVTLPLNDTTILGSKLSVSKDPNVTEILKTTPVDVVISSSGLKQLMDDTNCNSEWNIPVIIKTASDNSDKTIVYVDKPIPKRHPTPMDFNYYCQKLMIKTNFCCYPGITYNSSDIQTPIDTINTPEIGIELPEKQSLHGSKKRKLSNTKEVGNFSKLLDQKKRAVDKGDFLSEKRKICHNVSYRVWSMKHSSDKSELLKTKHSTKEIKILIRSKLDACEKSEDGTVRPVVIVPKLEYQLEHGANIPTKKEISDQWTALFFRPFSHLYRLRMQSSNSEIVDVESVSLQKLNNEASSFHQYKPHLRLDILYEILANLTDLKPRSYVLRYCRNKGPFIQIYSECDGDLQCDKFNFHQFYSKEMCSYVVPTAAPWTPIDPSYILPVHDTFKRMPGMFRPLINKKIGKQHKKKKNNYPRKPRGQMGKPQTAKKVG